MCIILTLSDIHRQMQVNHYKMYTGFKNSYLKNLKSSCFVNVSLLF
jgi:hypothetical protein